MGQYAYAPVEVSIHDGRSVRDALDYEDCGFTLLEHRSSATDWSDESHLDEVHGPEIEKLALEFSGCDRVIVYPPLARSAEKARSQPDYAAIEFVHSDFTDDYLAMIREPDRPYRQFFEARRDRAGVTQDEVDRAERVLMLQFWRNVGPRRPDLPFALCDGRSVPRTQLREFLVPYYAGARLEFRTFGVTPPADPGDNAWYTFPDLGLDEVIAFRTYDSRCAEEGRAFWTPHSAFRDPNAGPDAPARESVEMRALCLFGV
jgi:hypothetical protein